MVSWAVWGGAPSCVNHACHLWFWDVIIEFADDVSVVTGVDHYCLLVQTSKGQKTCLPFTFRSVVLSGGEVPQCILLWLLTAPLRWKWFSLLNHTWSIQFGIRLSYQRVCLWVSVCGFTFNCLVTTRWIVAGDNSRSSNYYCRDFFSVTSTDLSNRHYCGWVLERWNSSTVDFVEDSLVVDWAEFIKMLMALVILRIWIGIHSHENVSSHFDNGLCFPVPVDLHYSSLFSMS